MHAPSAFILERLRCPSCASRLAFEGDARCTGTCGRRFPVVDGVPVLIDEETSVFTIADVTERRKTFFDPRPARHPRLRRLLHALADNSLDLRTGPLTARFAELVKSVSPQPRVLVVGAGPEGGSVAALRGDPAIELVGTDVSLGPEVSIVCDAHQLPFADDTFDGVVAQAVLEHVADPYRCVDEMHRVVRGGGVVFSDTPFIQQVHGGRYDFTRFTHLGHLRLFRRWEEIESGASNGPGAALTWSYLYLLLCFARSPRTDLLLRIAGRLTSFWWKYLDPWLIETPGALDAASATYFLGRRSERVLSDRELVQRFRGANHRG
jgi:SAM-dependent methyltransferase